MYDAHVRRHALALLGSGLSIAAVSRLTGVSRVVIADWRRDPRRDEGLSAEPCVCRPLAGLHGSHGVLAALAVPFPATRAGPEAREADCRGRVTGPAREGAAAAISSGLDPFRRKSVPEHGDGQGPTLLVPTLFLHQQASQHPRSLRVGVRAHRRTGPAEQPLQRQRGAASRRSATRHVHRTEGLNPVRP